MRRELLALGLFALGGLPCLACIAIPGPPLAGQTAVQPSIRLEEQKAFLYRTGQNEHLVLSVRYEGGSGQFAWVIPTESRPQVDVQPGAPFHELEEATRVVDIQRSDAAVAPGGAPSRTAGVQVLERKEVGPYDVAVLRADSEGGLFQWLKTNGFPLSQNARAALDHYVRRKFVFVATRIRPGRAEDATTAERLRTGTIAPIHLTYRAAQLSYPLRVTAGNPGPSRMLLYVAGSTEPIQAPGLSSQRFQLQPQGQTGFTVGGPPGTVHAGGGEFPTLRKLLPKGGTLVRYSGVLTDDQRQQDLVFDKV